MRQLSPSKTGAEDPSCTAVKGCSGGMEKSKRVQEGLVRCNFCICNIIYSCKLNYHKHRSEETQRLQYLKLKSGGIITANLLPEPSNLETEGA